MKKWVVWISLIIAIFIIGCAQQSEVPQDGSDSSSSPVATNEWVLDQTETLDAIEYKVPSGWSVQEAPSLEQIEYRPYDNNMYKGLLRVRHYEDINSLDQFLADITKDYGRKGEGTIISDGVSIAGLPAGYIDYENNNFELRTYAFLDGNSSYEITFALPENISEWDGLMNDFLDNLTVAAPSTSEPEPETALETTSEPVSESEPVSIYDDDSVSVYFERIGENAVGTRVIYTFNVQNKTEYQMSVYGTSMAINGQDVGDPSGKGDIAPKAEASVSLNTDMALLPDVGEYESLSGRLLVTIGSPDMEYINIDFDIQLDN